jgi:hypothetical protein
MPFGLGFGELVLVFLVLLLPSFLFLVPAWRILTKAGYPGHLSLLLLVPIVNVMGLFLFAFAEWPLERRARPDVVR